MGIKNLSKLLKKCTFDQVHISKYKYQKIAVDISPFLFKYRIIFQDAWLKSFVNLVCCLRSNNVHVVFIYDGQSPPEKQAEKDSRRASRDKIKEKAYQLEHALINYEKTGEIAPILTTTGNVKLLDVGIDKASIINSITKYKKQSVNITHEDKLSTKKLLDNLGVPYIKAPEEAEKYASELYNSGLVSAVLSDDSDVLVYGATMLSRFDSKTGMCMEITPNKLLEQMKLTRDQFRDLCILLGTDYNRNIRNIGPEKGYNLIKRYGSIEGIAEVIRVAVRTGKSFEGIRDPKTIDLNTLNYQRVRELYTLNNVSVDIPYCRPPELRELCDYNVDLIVKDMIDNDNIVFEDD